MRDRRCVKVNITVAVTVVVIVVVTVAAIFVAMNVVPTYLLVQLVTEKCNCCAVIIVVTVML